MSGAAVTSFFLAFVWLGLAIAAAMVTAGMIDADSAPGPERDAVKDASLQFVWTIGILFCLGYAAAGVGLSMERPWGKAMAWLMMPWTLMLLLPGAPIGIYQMVALPKHP